MSATPTTPNPKPTPMVHNGQPAGGKHVPSNVPGAQVYEAVGAVGSNVVPMPGGDGSASDEVLSAPPFVAANPNASGWNPPLN